MPISVTSQFQHILVEFDMTGFQSSVVLKRRQRAREGMSRRVE